MAAGVIIEQEGGRLRLQDGNGDFHSVTEDNAYAVLCSIVNDSRLPPIKQVDHTRFTVEETVSATAAKLIPEPLRPLADLSFERATSRLRGGNRRIRRNGRCRR